MISALLFMSAVAMYYALSNWIAGLITIQALAVGGGFSVACVVFFVLWQPSKEPVRGKSMAVSFAISIATIAALSLLSAVSYIKAGSFMGMVIGSAVGSMFFSRTRSLPSFSRLLAPAIVGAAVFFPLRDMTFDVQTMASRSFEPRVQLGQKILVNSLAYGAKIPFSHFFLLRWGKPTKGDLVIVSGPNSRPYLRQVINADGSKLQLNTDGWVSSDSILAKAAPL